MAFSLPLSSSSLLLSSRKKRDSKRRKNTPVVIEYSITKQKTKKVRFQVPSDRTAATSASGQNQDNRGRHRYYDNKRQSKGSTNTWYTAKELNAFRADIKLTTNWMIVNGLGCEVGNNSGGDGFNSGINSKGNAAYMRVLYQEYKQYPFCSRGMECRTPIGQLLKKKRRKDALRSVFTLQKEQKQQQRNNERIRTIMNDDDGEDKNDKNTEALAKVYASYCKESCSLALYLGRVPVEAAAADEGVARSSLSRSAETEQQRQKMEKKMLLLSSTIVYHCQTLCDDIVSIIHFNSLIDGK